MTITPDDGKAGYRRPPVKHRWKKGQSGNSRNKPKSQPSALATIDQLLLASVTLTLDGETKSVSALEAIVTQLQRKEISGSARASRTLLKFREFAAQHTDRRLQLIFVDTEYTSAISNLGPRKNDGR